MTKVILFPFKGLYKGIMSSRQPIDTARDLQNVRPYADGRLRGGQRPGLAKATTTNGDGAVVEIATVTVVE